MRKQLQAKVVSSGPGTALVRVAPNGRDFDHEVVSPGAVAFFTADADRVAAEVNRTGQVPGNYRLVSDHGSCGRCSGNLTRLRKGIACWSAACDRFGRVAEAVL